MELPRSGRHFCVGADLSSTGFSKSARSARNVWALQRSIARIHKAIRRCHQSQLALTDDSIEAGLAFMEKREPDYKDR